MKRNRFKKHSLTAILIGVLVLGIGCTAWAGEGRVIATCDLMTKNTYKIFGRDLKVTEFRWRVNKEMVHTRGLASIQKKKPTRRYAFLDKDREDMTANGRPGTADKILQESDKRILGQMRMVNRGRIRMFGRILAQNDIVTKIYRTSVQKPVYKLVKIDGKLKIAHVVEDRPGKADKLLVHH